MNPSRRRIVLALASVVALAGLAALIPAARAADAAWTLTLTNAIEGGRALDLHLAVSDGACKAGFALAPKFNRMVHAVDAGGLKVEGDTLSGEVKVTLRPDAWVPKSGQPVACVYTLAVTGAGSTASGSFTGTYGEVEVKGGIGGAVAPQPAIPDTATLEFTMEKAKTGEAKKDEWKERGVTKLTLKQGKLDGKPFIRQDKTGDWSGAVDAAELAFDGPRITGTITATINTIPYVYTLDLVRVGNKVAGPYTIKRDGADAGSSVLAGTMTPAP